jgi:hypothetical protein
MPPMPDARNEIVEKPRAAQAGPNEIGKQIIRFPRKTH